MPLNYDRKDCAEEVLSNARKECIQNLENRSIISYNNIDIINLLEKYWEAFKSWEQNDTFEKAFLDSRMTIRTYNPPDQSSKWNTISQELSISGQIYNLKYDVSGEGIRKRMDGNNFIYGSSKKYELGLHDLSASLLDPEQLISKQIYHNLQQESKNRSYVVFMPLPLQEDLNFIDQLNKICKNEPKLHMSIFHQKIRYFLSNMTRLKVAYERDIGAGFQIKDSSTPNIKIKYSYGSRIKTQLHPLGTRITDKDIKHLRNNAINYKNILEQSNNKAKYNEIIISYRSHQNKMFPLLSKWNYHNKTFESIDRTWFYHDSLDK